jgi:hypothetical protein
MFWRGGMSPTGYFNRDGWFGRGPLLGADTECNGDTCVIIASRLTPDQAKVSYDKIKWAFANKPECISQGVPADVSDSAAAKLEKTILGIDSSAALTRSEADWLAKFEACVGVIPTAAVVPPGPIAAVKPSTQPSPLLIGAGALAVIGLILAIAK